MRKSLTKMFKLGHQLLFEKTKLQNTSQETLCAFTTTRRSLPATTAANRARETAPLRSETRETGTGWHKVGASSRCCSGGESVEDDDVMYWHGFNGDTSSLKAMRWMLRQSVWSLPKCFDTTIFFHAIKILKRFYF